MIQYDGENFINYINNDDYNPNKALYWTRNYDIDKMAMRRGKYKIFLNNKNATPELFNLELDPYEKNDLYPVLSDTAIALKKDLMLWSSQNIPQVVAF